jgi:hypothetical protein
MEEASIRNLTEKKHRMVEVRLKIGKISWADLMISQGKVKISCMG